MHGLCGSAWLKVAVVNLCAVFIPRLFPAPALFSLLKGLILVRVCELSEGNAHAQVLLDVFEWLLVDTPRQMGKRTCLSEYGCCGLHVVLLICGINLNSLCGRISWEERFSILSASES